jgi:hypothetical protein
MGLLLKRWAFGDDIKHPMSILSNADAARVDDKEEDA